MPADVEPWLLFDIEDLLLVDFGVVTKLLFLTIHSKSLSFGYQLLRFEFEAQS